MAVNKQEALDHIAEVYEYTLGLPGGPSHIFSRELAVWMQRHWAQAGANAATEKRRAKNTASKQATTSAPAQSDGLKKFVHPKSPEAKSGETLAPKSNAVEVPLPVEAQQEQPMRPLPVQERLKSQSPVVGDDPPLSDADLQTISVMKPRSILVMFGETRITAALKALGVSDEDMPDSGAQKAAMLKQRKK